MKSTETGLKKVKKGVKEGVVWLSYESQSIVVISSFKYLEMEDSMMNEQTNVLVGIYLFLFLW